MASQIYSGAASFGRAYTDVSSIVAGLLGTALVAGGAYMFVQKDDHTATTQGTVRSVSATPDITHMAQVTVEYTPKGATATCTATISVGAQQAPAVGSTVTVYYDPSDATACSAELSPVPYKLVGSLMAGFGAVIIAGALINVYLARNYKAYAAVEGVYGGMQLAKNL